MSSLERTTSVVLVLLTIGMQTGASAATRQITGVVFDDTNGNSIREPNEQGIAGVRVSDQISVVTTGSDGSFVLDSDGGYGVVYAAQPPGYRAGGEFWQPLSEADESLNFPMVQAENPAEFTFIHASDPHLSEETLPRMHRLREIVDEQQPSFVLITGDLIRDALRVGEAEATGLYELLMQELAEFPVPVWTALGNHEIFGIERHQSLVSPDNPMYGKKMYRHFLGPNYYSFDFGGVRFVCLDTVDYDDLWYNGYVDEDQMEWLRQDLEGTGLDRSVVTFNHIPLLSAGENVFGFRGDGPAPSLITVDGETRYRHTVANAGEVLTELRQYRFDLALSGHLHMREKLFFESHGVKTRFYMTSAVRSDTPDRSGLDMISGVALYRATDGVIDDGTLIPLDPQE